MFAEIPSVQYHARSVQYFSLIATDFETMFFRMLPNDHQILNSHLETVAGADAMRSVQPDDPL
jgi:hypothetical protein